MFRNDIDPFSLEGSYAGAFGYGQFIPSSFNKLSIDYDKDGKDPFNKYDVVGSIAFYLVENGYPKMILILLISQKHGRQLEHIIGQISTQIL